jgi:hypothetical protein
MESSMSETVSMESMKIRWAMPGQGGMIAVAITILITLVLVGGSISSMSQLNAQQSVVTKQSLQTFYAAQAGIQEALASRMLPRSNYLNFDAASDPSNGGKPLSEKRYYGRSGNIYQDPSNTTRGLIAKYRYLVVGGDSARQNNGSGSYYAPGNMTPGGVSRLLSTDTIPADSPFFVISTGTTCKSAQGTSASLPDKLTTGITPGCSSGTQKDEVTVVATVRMNQEPPSVSGAAPKDQIVRQRVYKNNTRIPLESAAFVPGYGWLAANTGFDFNQAWSYQGGNDVNNDPMRLMKVVFYNFADNTVYKNCAVGESNLGASVNCGNVPTNSAIRLYFNGAFDYRTISPRADLSDKELKDCKPTGSNPNQADNCRIRVVPNPPMSGSNHAYSGNTTIPLLPGGTQVILLPPMVALSAGQVHQLEIDGTKLRGFSNNPGKTDYRITFTTI